jgi:predicted nuclease of predicted toxin-antitoxin system
LQFAQSTNSVCCTLDADFHRYLAAGRMLAPSVIRIRIEGLQADETASLLTRVAEDFEQELISGAAVTITRKSVRLRRLPIGGFHLHARG